MFGSYCKITVKYLNLKCYNNFTDIFIKGFTGKKYLFLFQLRYFTSILHFLFASHLTIFFYFFVVFTVQAKAQCESPIEW